MAFTQTTSPAGMRTDTVARPLGAADWVALALVIVGGLNWLLVGAFDFNLVAAIFGAQSTLSRIVYVLVGLAAIFTLFDAMRFRRTG